MSRRSRDPRVPRLLPEVVADDSALGGVIDGVITGNDNYVRATAKILAAQDRLQRLCDEDAWVEYLHVEQVMNDRVSTMLALVARWAFDEGRRHQQRR
jgi:hypothetical protein